MRSFREIAVFAAKHTEVGCVVPEKSVNKIKFEIRKEKESRNRLRVT